MSEVYKNCAEIYNNEEYEDYFSIYNSLILSDFQKYSIQAIIDGKNSLVTAHTGSGKTLPAEFAIYYFTKQNKKVYYLSPIKALSNQKSHDFINKFKNISFGILTGDIKVNPDAEVVIMTTEILRNMLVKGNIDENVACFIFDEVHYINDPERGKVWEECIIMAPKNVQLLMLSATIDNAVGFASWVGKVTNRETWISSTEKRIVPLYHHIYITAPSIEDNKTLEKQCKNKYFMIKDTEFNTNTYDEVKNIKSLMYKKHINATPSAVMNEICAMLYKTDTHDKNMLPAICFVFSREHAEILAKNINISLLPDDSKFFYDIDSHCRSILLKLGNPDEYMNLPEYKKIKELLQRGIAVHHSGVIPVFRELIEILFVEERVQLLFATETFSVGLNIPSKTIIFSSLYKRDSNQKRLLYSHEYTQMAGRAGRRGTDTEGHIIHCANLYDMIDIHEYKHLLSGIPQKLVSKFKIGYNLVLNDKSISSLSMNSEKVMKEINSLQEDFYNLPQAKQLTVDNLILDKYHKLHEELNKNIGNQRKKFIKSINELEKVNSNIKSEYVIYKKNLEINNNQLLIQNKILEKEKEMSPYYVETILSSNSFFEIEKKTISLKINEVHPLVFTDLLLDTNFFEDYSAKEIAILLSCVIEIKIENDDFVEVKGFNKLEELYGKYLDCELKFKITTGEKYNIHKKLAKTVNDWYDAQNEAECRLVIDMIKLFLGEFVKSFLKIVNISNEFARMSEDLGKFTLLTKLQEIEKNLLKYIVTNQSLYV